MIPAQEKLMRKRELESRTRQFAVAVFRMLDELPRAESTRVIAFQLGKSASSIGANYHEANRAESLDDFVHKIGIVLKEASETSYWLSVLSELCGSSEILQDLINEATELTRIFQSSNRSLRQRKLKQSNK